MKTSALAIAAVAALGASASGAFFGFEDQAASTLPDGTRQGGYSQLDLSDGGVDLTITRVGGDDFDIFDNDTFFNGNPGTRPPATWQTRSLDPFIDGFGNSGIGFVLSFAQMVENFSIDYGDFGDDADTIEIELYTDATLSTLVNSDSANLPGNSTFDFTSGTVAVAGQFQVAIIRGGSDPFFHSIFFDNISVTEVPAPTTCAVIGAGLIGAGRRRRR